MRQIEVDGLRIAYERAGTGPPIVLVHGGVGDGRATWRSQIDALSDEYTVVAWDALLPTMFSDSAPDDGVRRFRESMSEFHPAGFRVMARSFAEADLGEILPRIDVPTLLLYGAEDIRSPLSVAEEIHAAIRTSQLVVLPRVGHV